MYAVVVRESGDPEAISGSGEHLAANVVPAVRKAPGIVSAVYMTDGAGKALSVFIFESEEAARATVERLRTAPRPGFIHVESVEPYAVLAHF
jgi:hypothetical protein